MKSVDQLHIAPQVQTSRRVAAAASRDQQIPRAPRCSAPANLAGKAPQGMAASSSSETTCREVRENVGAAEFPMGKPISFAMKMA